MRSTWPAPATSSRPRSRPEAPPARLHLLGGGLRVRCKFADQLTEDVERLAPSAIRIGPEGRGRGGAVPGPGRLGHRGLRLPPLHRRRAGCAASDRLDTDERPGPPPSRSGQRHPRSPAGLRPVLPDPGVPFQLVHHDDVAAALCAAVTGEGEPGIYNLDPARGRSRSRSGPRAGLARGSGPEQAGRATAVTRGCVPARPGVLDRGPAPTSADGHQPRSLWRKLAGVPKHDARQTLREMVAALPRRPRPPD